MGQLKQTLFCSKFALKAMDNHTKGKLYEALVLGILLYGGETWALTTTNRQKLNKFHNACVRYLCGVRRTHQRQHAPTMASLFAKLHVHSMDHYLNTRYIRPSTSPSSGNDAIAVIAPPTESAAVCTRVLRSHGRRDNIT